jgi:tetratricopeptide (TPR) repeat protein
VAASVNDGLFHFSDRESLVETAARLAEGQHDWATALSHWEVLRNIHPGEWKGMRGVATALRELGRLGEAEILLQQATLLSPEDINVRHDLARLAELRNDWRKAEEYWRAALTIDPHYWAANAGLAGAFRHQGRPREAEALLLDCQKRNPSEIAYIIDYARVADSERNWSEAAIRWQFVSDKFPHSFHGYTGHAAALREMCHLDEAEAILRDARSRFPDEMNIPHDLARVAERRGDWAAAERHWRDVLAIDLAPSTAHVGLALALRQQGRLSEASAVLLDGQKRHPTEIVYFIDHARLADTQRDWQEAERRWLAAQKLFPQSFHGYVGLAAALWEQGRPTDAERYLHQTIERFPNQSEPYHYLGIFTARRGDWAMAEHFFRIAVSLAPNNRYTYIGLAEALGHLGRVEDTRAVLLDAQVRFPFEPDVFSHLPWLEVRALEWGRAEAACRAFAARFPKYGQSYIIASEVFQRQFRFKEAQAILADGIERADDAPDVMIAMVKLLSRDDVREFFSASEYLERARSQFPDNLPVYVASVRQLRHIGRAEDAKHLAADAIRRWPLDLTLAREHATSGVTPEELAERVEWFGTIRNDHPAAAAGYIGLALALELSNRPTEADLVMASAMDQFPHDMDVAMEAIQLAEKRDDWVVAVRRWAALGLRLPNDKRVSDRLFVAWLRLAEAGQVDDAASKPQASATDSASLRDLCMNFESLGGTGGGCEFGIFQREHGAEPLGLLRWTTVRPDALAAGLTSRFEGVGDPENTILHPEVHSPSRQEYVTTDRNFGLRMHTFVYTDEHDHEKFHSQICRRLQYLRRKILDDLAAGEKVFVYKTVERELSDSELEKIYLAMRDYGDNTLLYIRYSDATHPDGTVVQAKSGLLIGYIDHFQQSRTGESGPVVTHSWRALCVAALQLFREDRALIA